MKYGIIKDNKFIFIDDDKTRLKTTLKYLPQFKEEDIQEYKDSDIEIGADNNYYLKGYAPQKPLNELKAQKKEEINQARDKAEQGGFEYLGKVFDSDAISCQRIALASQSALISKENGSEFNVVWTCQDNTTIELDADKMIGVSIALTQWSNTCHIKASELKSKVDKALTEEELNNIT